MLGPSTLDEPFTPAKGLRYARQASEDPNQLIVNGIKIATVMYHERAQYFYSQVDPEQSTFTSRFRTLGAFGHMDRDNLTLCCRTLAAGNPNLEGPERQDAEVADFAAWLFEQELNRASYDSSRYDTHAWFKPISCQQCGLTLLSTSNDGDSLRFRQQVNRSHQYRHLFVTSGGHLGIGTEQMLSGDIICILGGADMPFIIRREKDHYRLVGECYIDDIMNGEAVQSMKDRETHKGLFDPEFMISQLFEFKAYPPKARKVLYEMRREILDSLDKQYGSLKEEFINIR